MKINQLGYYKMLHGDWNTVYSLSNNDNDNNNNNIVIFSFGLWGNIKKEVLQEERK